MNDPRDNTIASLRAELQRRVDENDDLRFRLAQVCGQAGLWPDLGFTKTEEKLVRALWKRGSITKDFALDVLYGDRPDGDLPGDKIVDVLVCKIRKKMPMGSIQNQWARGWSLTPIGRSWLAARLEGERDAA